MQYPIFATFSFLKQQKFMRLSCITKTNHAFTTKINSIATATKSSCGKNWNHIQNHFKSYQTLINLLLSVISECNYY